MNPKIEVCPLNPDLVQVQFPDRTYILPLQDAFDLATDLAASLRVLRVRVEREPPGADSD